MTDADLYKLAERVGARLKNAGYRLVTAESCTAGWIAKAVTDVPGSSDWFDSGFVTYSNDAKRRDLGVLEATLDKHGAVSEAVVREMAEGVLERTGADIAVSTSGIAGPTGAVPGKPVGTVWFAVSLRRGRSVDTTARVKLFEGSREDVRRRSAHFALTLIGGLELPDRRVGRTPP